MLATLNLRTILANPLSGNSAELQHAKRMLDMCLLRDLNPLLFFRGQCEIESRFSGALTGDTVGTEQRNLKVTTVVEGALVYVVRSLAHCLLCWRGGGVVRFTICG